MLYFLIKKTIVHKWCEIPSNYKHSQERHSVQVEYFVRTCAMCINDETLLIYDENQTHESYLVGWSQNLQSNSQLMWKYQL